MEDTIVGVATAAGEGGVAIVRVSGPEAVRLFEEAFRPKGAKPPYESHRLMVGHAVDETGPIDEAMGVVMYAPRSYTREDVCEIHTHGGAAAASTCSDSREGLITSIKNMPVSERRSITPRSAAKVNCSGTSKSTSSPFLAHWPRASTTGANSR